MRKKYWQTIAENLFLWSVPLFISWVIAALIVARQMPPSVSAAKGITVSGLFIIIMMNSEWVVRLFFGNSQQELPAALEEAIETDHGMNLSNVMEALRDELVEYKAVFDANGNKLAEGSILSPSKCALPKGKWSQISGRAKINLHNHPSLSDGSFSPQDFHSLVACQFRQDIVITLHYTYIMDAFRSDLTTLNADKVKQYAETMYQKIQNNAVVYFSLSTGICENLVWRLCTIAVSRAVADRYGWKFHVEPAWFTRLRMRHPRISVVKCRKVALAGAALCFILMGAHMATSRPKTAAIARTTIDSAASCVIVDGQLKPINDGRVCTKHIEVAP